ncbi:hypothetical protein [Halovivax cerinus]|uniref:Uncharacterized protein n=1 Tax=Halovivax cerinus TaxID=1487865 RepID=A0ABD5NPW7_9EURY|nr:hypothetical protein [Halovivax cerinus]
MSVQRTPSRRGVLQWLAAGATVGLAGCSAVANWIGDAVLGDVNLFNTTSDRLAGTISVVDPEGTTVLESDFDLPSSDGGGPEESNETGETNETSTEDAGIYTDVWTTAGSYEVSVSLADGESVSGETDGRATIDVDDTDETMLAVFFGAEDEYDEPIAFTTGTTLTDLESTTN